MNISLRSFVSAGPLVSAMIFVGLVGCQSNTGVSRASATANALQDHARWIEGLKRQVTTTVASLDELVQASNTDPRTPYRKFERAVAGTERDAASVWRNFVAVEGRAEEHFRHWEIEIDAIGSSDLRKLSRERCDEAKAKLQQNKKKEADLRQKFGSFVQSLKDVQAYLNNNLNPSGIVAASEQIAGIKNTASKLQLETDAVIAKVNELRLAISPQQTSPSRRQ